MTLAERLYHILRAQLGARARRQQRPAPPGFGTDSAFDPAPGPPPGSSVRPPPLNPELARYYANLELPYGADLAQVNEAWKRMVRKYHPDLHSQDPERQKIATELVKGLNHAHDQLKAHLEK